MEACFSQLTLDVIGKAVFNYDFDALTMSSPVIQVLQQPPCIPTLMPCRTPASALLQQAFVPLCMLAGSLGMSEGKSITQPKPALA